MRIAADAAGDEHFALRDAVPEAFAGAEEGLVVGPERDVRHAGVEIEGADGVSDRFGLFPDGLVRLIVIEGPCLTLELFDLFCEIVRLGSAFINEIFGQVKIFFVAGRIGEFAESEFNLFVSGVSAELSGGASEDAGDVVGVTAHAVEEVALPGRLPVRDGGFHEVSGAVEFVVFVEVFPAHVGGDDREEDVQIAVRPLGGADEIHIFVELFFAFGIGVEDEVVRHAFENFGNVGIPEEMRLIRHSLLPVETECFQAFCFVAFADVGREGVRVVGCDARREISVVQTHFSDF